MVLLYIEGSKKNLFRLDCGPRRSPANINETTVNKLVLKTKQMKRENGRRKEEFSEREKKESKKEGVEFWKQDSDMKEEEGAELITQG